MRDAQWTPATFDIAMGEPGATGPNDPTHHTEPVEGETWGAFGINGEEDGPSQMAWFVTHLPTGYKLAEVGSRKAARRFCEEIEPLADWASVRPGELPPGLRDACRKAWYRAHQPPSAPTTAAHPADEPAPWPPPAVEGEPLALPGMESVPEKPAERYPT